MEDLDTLYANKLRYLRLSGDLKQELLAKELSLSQQSYSKLETGKTQFSDEIIARISQYFNITPAEFVKPMERVQISNSPNAHSSHHHINDIKLIEANHLLTLAALQAKDETIAAKDEVIQTLKDLLHQTKA